MSDGYRYACCPHCEHDPGYEHAGPCRACDLADYRYACCVRAVYDDRIGWWCPEHGDQP